jgi:inner membrane protein
MAIFPDLDFIPGMLQGQPNRYHQGISHSLGAALVVSFASAVFTSRGNLWKQWTILCAAYMSHLAIDFFGPDGRPPYGQPLFWPISEEHFISPLSVFPGMRHAGSTHASMLEWTKGVLSLHNFRSIAIDIALMAPFVILANWFTKGSSSRRGDTPDGEFPRSAR